MIIRLSGIIVKTLLLNFTLRLKIINLDKILGWNVFVLRVESRNKKLI